MEIPVAIKIEDYTKATVFCGIDLNAFTEISGQDNLGNTPRLLLGGQFSGKYERLQWTYHFKETAE